MKQSILLVLALSLILNARGAGAQPDVVGQWSGVQAWPIVSVHTQMLHTGQVVFWAYNNTQKFYRWDPVTSSVVEVSNAGRNVFCCGQAQLADGRILVPGGHNRRNGWGLKSASIYDPVSNRWDPVPNMNEGRWYPSATTLANGDVLVASGSYNTRYTNNDLQQVFQAATNSWRDLTSARMAMALYPHTFLAPNGKVFFATQTSRYLDTSGTGSWTTVSNHRVGGRENYSSSCMYEPGKVLTTGGSDPPTATCEVIDLNQATPQWNFTGSMSIARRQQNLTILPDGKVLVTGGSSAAGFNEPAGAVLFAEVWDPATGVWSRLAGYQRYRGYHSTAVLLPDGRVLSSGGDNEPNAEVFSPPYLFKGAQPTISSAPVSITYGQNFTVGTPNAAGIAQVTWIRLGSLTHAQNWDQRFMRLSFSAGSGSLNVTAPSSANNSPPGYYMLFILNGTGVPSAAKIVQIR